ncbi:MAG: tol-pal system protein YbgF [Deltaproteobacteria bacterium]|nr:tol-pal system protein YbgF [Deltaproteobacteria bacterium]
MEEQIRELRLALELQEEKQERIKNTQDQITAIVGKKRVRARGSPNTSLYEKARAKLQRKEYAAAITQFQQYIARYPKSNLADNAQYWIGEAMYARGRYEEAVLAFDKVITQYKKSNKIPAALLMQGMSFLNIDDRRSARILFTRLINEFPTFTGSRHSQTRIAAYERILKALRSGPPGCCNSISFFHFIGTIIASESTLEFTLKPPLTLSRVL